MRSSKISDLGGQYGLTTDYLPEDEDADVTIFETSSCIYLALGTGQYGLVSVAADILLTVFAKSLSNGSVDTNLLSAALEISGQISNQVYDILLGIRQNQAIKERLVCLILQSQITPGYRCIRNGKLSWICETSGTGSDFVQESPTESACIAMFQKYIPGAKMPYDVAVIATNRGGKSSSAVWKPLGQIFSANLLGTNSTNGVQGSSINQIPSAMPTGRLIGDTDDPLRMPIMGAFMNALSQEQIPETVKTIIRRRWVAALYADSPETSTAYAVSLEKDLPYASGPYVEEYDENKYKSFDLFWDELLAQVPTFRQILGPYLGFSVT